RFVTFDALADCGCGGLVVLRAQWLRWAMAADTRAASGTPMPAPGMTHLAEWTQERAAPSARPERAARPVRRETADESIAPARVHRLALRCTKVGIGRLRAVRTNMHAAHPPRHAAIGMPLAFLSP
ncbi:hypothetical protein OIV57_34150, partial [Burkholderia pseudomallei]|nr:hypothetical protein [Burkholderia pseudomallei]